MVNVAPEMVLPAPQSLAIAYAPAAVRPQLRWLLLLDLRLQGILAKVQEPLIAQIRLAWWRDMLGKVPEERPKGEPLLARLAELEPNTSLIEAAIGTVNATELQLAGGDDAAIARARSICSAYASWTGADLQMAEMLAIAWGEQASDVIKSTRALRPLSILALAEQLERGTIQPGILGAGVRLSWHALTGR